MPLSPKSILVAILFVTSFALGSSAIAQKSKDTLRHPILHKFSTLDIYHFPQDEVGYFSRVIYDTLIAFDEHKKKFVPRLAKSWKRIDKVTLEFDLRDDVYFHSGNKFTAADVKYTIDYLIDPKVKLRFKGWYKGIKKVEVIGPHRVRIIGVRPNATDLTELAYRYWIYDSKVHSALKTNDKKKMYGRVSASGTGPYKLVSFDDNKGLVLQRFDKYYGDKYGRAPIKTIEGIWMPDLETQLANFLGGQLDILRNVRSDTAKQLRGRKGIVVTPTETKSIIFMTLDAVGRSANKSLKDIRVRQAIMAAINRKELVKSVIPGGDIAELPDTICFRSNIGCAPTTTTEAYNPARAKELLAKAGYSDGLRLELSVHDPVRDIGEAIIGYLHKVGIKATLRPLTLSAMAKARGQGQTTALINFFPTAGTPDVSFLLSYYFGGNRDYTGDPMFLASRKKGLGLFDLKKRTENYVGALDQVNRKAYIYPIAEKPTVFIHTDKIRIEKNLLSTGQRRVTDIFWK